MGDFQNVVGWLSGLGVTGLLFLFFVLLWRGDLVWKREIERRDADYEELKADRDRWLDVAMEARVLARETERVRQELEEVVPEKVRKRGA